MDLPPPNPDKWQRRYGPDGSFPSEPSRLLTDLRSHLPTSGTALDVAAGAGRHAVWLATEGFDVTWCDFVPNARERAQEAAAAAGVALRYALSDLTVEPLPAGAWDLIVSFHFLHRPLFAQWREALAPGGILVFVQPTVVNLQRHERPPRPFLVEEGEVEALTRSTGLNLLVSHEGWLQEGRHEALIVAQRID